MFRPGTHKTIIFLLACAWFDYFHSENTNRLLPHHQNTNQFCYRMKAKLISIIIKVTSFCLHSENENEFPSLYHREAALSDRVWMCFAEVLDRFGMGFGLVLTRDGSDKKNRTKQNIYICIYIYMYIFQGWKGFG